MYSSQSSNNFAAIMIVVAMVAAGLLLRYGWDFIKAIQSGYDGDEKACPFCGETIKSIATKCRFCGSDLEE